MIPGFNGMHGLGWGGYGWIGWILNLVVILGLIVGVVLLVVWLLRKTSSGSSGPAVTSYSVSRLVGQSPVSGRPQLIGTAFRPRPDGQGNTGPALCPRRDQPRTV